MPIFAATESKFMSPRAKLLALAAAMEVPLVAFLYVSPGNDPNSLLVSANQYYHALPVSLVSLVWLLLFGHGSPSVGTLGIWHSLYFFCVFVGQTPLTALLLWLALRKTSFLGGGNVQ